MRWNEVGAVRQAARLTQLLRTISPTIGDVNSLPGGVVGPLRQRPLPFGHSGKKEGKSVIQTIDSAPDLA